MAQFDVYAEPGRHSRFLVNVQADLLESLSFRVVVPLFPTSPALMPIGRLNPIMEIHGTKLMLMTHLIAPIPAKTLGPIVANLSGEIDIISNALDILFKGF
jgi:toxin CcdB